MIQHINSLWGRCTGVILVLLYFLLLQSQDYPLHCENSQGRAGLRSSPLQISQVHEAIFVRSPSALYSFAVRTQHTRPVRYTHGAVQQLVILASWWKSWWFRSVAALVLLTLFWLLYRFRILTFRRENRRLKEELSASTTELQQCTDELAETSASLESEREKLLHTKEKLTYASKMASLGQLTAGIAHEIKNPINFVNNFAESSVDISEEIRAEMRKHDSKPQDVIKRIEPLIEELVLNAQKIIEHGKRVDHIVQSMLLHSHNRPAEREETPVNDFVEQYVTLAFHGMRAQVQDFTVVIDTRYDEDAGIIPLVPQDIARVLVNLLSNAFQAVNDRRLKEAASGYQPVVRVRTERLAKLVRIVVEDNGSGVDPEYADKIFEPFFTTKDAGTGTGLGLSLSHEIVVKEHHGDLRYENVEKGGARFVIELPIGVDGDTKSHV